MDWRYFGNNHRDHWCLNSRTWNLWRLWWTLCCGERWDCSGLSQWFVCRTFNFLGSVLYDVLMLPHPTKHTPHMHDQVLWGRMAIPIANQHFLWGLCAWSARSSNASVPALSTWCWLCPELQPRPYLASLRGNLLQRTNVVFKRTRPWRSTKWWKYNFQEWKGSSVPWFGFDIDNAHSRLLDVVKVETFIC